MIRIALVDDDDFYLKQMQDFLHKYSTEHAVDFQITIFHDGLNFVEDYNAGQDIILMDIEMPLLDGMEASRRIRKKDSQVAIIFITNMAQYAIRGYEVHAIDFILKPLEYYAFTDRLTRALRIAALNTSKTIVLRTADDKVIRMPISSLLYVEKNGNYVVYHVRKNNTETDSYTMRGTLSEIENELQKNGFSCPSKGIWCNLRFVDKVTKKTVTVGQQVLPLSRRRYREFLTDLMKYLGGTFR